MKYIDAEELIKRLEEMKQAEYENCGGVNSKTGALQEVQELINSLQQEQPKKKEEQKEPLVEQYRRTGLVLETIFGNKVLLSVDNIEEMVWYPAGIADIYTAHMHYFVKMDALDFDRLVTLRGNKYKEKNESTR